jgi:uncharacterized repeat protein (TIGR01451 family)
MRKLKLTSNCNTVRRISLFPITVLFALLLIFSINTTIAQCVPFDGSIQGVIHLDEDFDGVKSIEEKGIRNIMVYAYDAFGTLVAQAISNDDGSYLLAGMIDGNEYRIEFDYPVDYYPSFNSINNRTTIQFTSVPACDMGLALQKPNEFCSLNPQIALTCFVQGGMDENTMLETLVTLSSEFDANSSVNKFATKAETGSIWGLTYKKSTKELFSAAMVKQYASLTQHGLGAIFKTDLNSNPVTTELFVDLASMGINLGTLVPSDVNDCAYGEQVGKKGLGSLELSSDESLLYTINLNQNTLVILPTIAPDASNITEITIPDPGCSNGEYQAFALKYYNEKLYVGLTCTAETAQDASLSMAYVYEFDPVSETFTSIFSTNYIKGYWKNYPSNTQETSHWLTDLDFTDEGTMILSLSDRIGHRFCNNTTGRLDAQNPDILLVWNNNGVWTLENNGAASFYTGTGVGNGQGPGGGEFFGDDFWPHKPELHPEIALGSVYAMPGTGEVIASVYDPLDNSYSGGLHRYMTGSGTKVGAIELYSHSVNPEFGKASGFGDIIPLCETLPIEIGNFVWMDADNDGIQDAGEAPINSLQISLFDANCNQVGTTTTDINGNYYFNNSNVDIDGNGEMDGLEYGKQYYVVLNDPSFDKGLGSLVLNDEHHLLSQLNIGTGAHKDLNDMDASIADGICDLLNGYPVISLMTQGSGQNNHSFDLGLFLPDNFDLALKKVANNPTPVQYGEIVNFTIEVFNQGNVGAKNIEIIDYVPGGFEFDIDLNSGWKASGDNATYTITGPLSPGNKSTIELNLRVAQGAQANQLINFAEISRTQDQFGNIPVDVDSSPDIEKGNDNGGDPFGITDNEINDNGDIDEDDHDPAVVDVFDLALRKTINDPIDFYMAGDEVLFDISIFNQGNMVAKVIDVVDYVPEGLEFVDDLVNEHWEWVEGNIYRITIENGIFPGSSENVQILLRVKEDVQQDQLINKAEIAAAHDENGNSPLDIDSNPNLDESDDIGGNVFDFTNDEINNDGTIDEDDHDPEMVQIHYYDLALMKTTDKTRVNIGDEVKFKIYIINQGSITADRISIVDYLPLELDLNDTNWVVDPSDPSGKTVTRFLSVENGMIAEAGLLPEEHLIVEINTIVNESAGSGFINNYAEISSAYDISGSDMSAEDSDSSPDQLKDNDNGGIPFGPTDNEINDHGDIDEDDHDPATVFVSPAIVTPCTCLDNATDPDNGQFFDRISILGGPNEMWEVDQVSGLFDISSPAPPSAPTDIASGTFLTEVVLVMGLLSEYYIDGIHIDGQGYFISFVNAAGAVDEHTSVGCQYLSSGIDGSNGACIGSTESYSIANANPANVYSWSLAQGGNIVGPTTGTSIEVQWGNTFGVPYDLVIQESGPDTCYSPVFFEVTLGTDAGALACNGNINASLDVNCELVVTPEMLLTQGLDPNAFYNVMVKDEYDNLIPNATLTGDHIGGVFYGKAIDMCGNNSCWSTITVEDKMPPTITCTDTIIPCHEMDFYLGPVIVDNCDPNPTMTLLNELITPYTCNDTFVKKIVRTYIAEDQYGNVSAECSQTIRVERIDLNDVVFPLNRRVSDGNPLQCDVMMEDGVPPYQITGVPTIGGKALYPNTDQYCNIGVSFTDIVLPQVGCVKKIMRRWMVYEAWCSDGPYEIVPQFIEIIDDTAPVIDCPDDIVMTTNGYTCEASVVLPPVNVEDNCSDDIRVDIAYPGGFIGESNGGIITLPAGVHEVTYTVYDECLNSTSCAISVTIEDVTAPVVICDQHTVVGLRSDGSAYAYAHTFDDGTYDDCGIDYIEVRRMDNGSPCGLNDDFGPTVEFCCADAGNNIMVIMRAWDKAGNSNECMVDVLVQDKFPPEILCPADVTLECATEIDFENLDIFGTATAIDQCGATVGESVSSFFDQCGEGYVYRDFTATDANGSSNCRQVISLINSDPFKEGDIDWPDNYETDAGCNAGDLIPENIPVPFNAPVVHDDFCDLVGVSYEDFVFPFEDDNNSCLKIIRKWSVIDWCTFEDNQYEIYKYDQIIKVTNSIAPEITSSCDALTTCTFDDDCESGPITLVANATDDCTPENALTWEYQIDLDRNGIREIIDSGFGASIDATGDYPIGDHSIYWTFEDRCGNKTTCVQDFSIVNCKPPTAACIEGLAISLVGMDTDGDGEVDTEMACITPEQFDASSFHPCGYELDFSFSSDPDDDIRCFDCFNIGLNIIEIWVTDINGNQDYCETTIEVQDNNDENICQDPKDCITWPDDLIIIDDCDADTDPDVLGSEPTIDPDCICSDYTITFVDSDISDPGNTCQTISRVWTVTFNCYTDLDCSFTQTLELSNVEAPELVCFGNDVVGSSTNGNCEAFVEVPGPTFDSSCNSGIVVTNDSDYGISDTDASGTYPVGSTVVTFTATDICGNSSTCSTTVVVTDDSPPTCSAMDITIMLTNNSATITGADIDDGSTDDCGGSITADADITQFDCDNVGENTVILIVTDENGNSSTCPAMVTVTDNVAPICIAQGMTIVLVNGMATINPEDLDNGSFDPCGEVVDLSVDPAVVDCDDIGLIFITLSITDNSGNVTMCNVPVNVVDDVTPECLTQDITVALDDTQMVTITGADVDGGSTDDCGEIVDLSVVPNTFVCADLGDNVVTLTVTDNSNNSSSCTATVTVIDEVAPICMTQDITVTIDNGSVSITPGDIDDGSFDPCGEIVDLSVTPDEFTCNDIGVSIVTLTVTDMNGNSSTCTAEVTVTDIVAPVCVAMDITVILDETSTAVITGEDVDGGSSDACGEIVTLVVIPNLFDCDDLGDNDVVLTVFDDAGNSSSCDAVVTVQDTMMPVCMAMDIIVLLDENGEVSITPEDIDDGSTTVCDPFIELAVDPNQFFCNDIGENTVTLTVTDGQGNTSTCQAIVTVEDEVDPMITCPADTIIACDSPLDDLSIYGVATATDNCDGDVDIAELQISDLNVCNVGQIERTFTAIDNEGNSNQCMQTITVGMDGDFISESDITWPMDTVILVDCTDINPDSLETGIPEIDTSMATCFILSIEFVDVSQNPEETCTDTIQRTWTVVDSCQLDETSGEGIFTFEQIIIINDTFSPMIETIMDTTLYVDTLCIASAVLPGSYTDCQGMVTVTNDSPFADDNNSVDLSGDYEPGEYLVTITAEDGCGNVATAMVNISVLDTIPPVIKCFKPIVDMDDSGMLEFPISEILFGPTDNCTDSLDLTCYYVDSLGVGDPADTILMYTCENIGDNFFYMLCIDEAGNESICAGIITINDPNGICDNFNEAVVSGLITTELNNVISDVEVNLMESEMPYEMTDDDGEYSFPAMPAGGDYEVMPAKDIDPVDGVSTLDVILIQRHILGISLLDSPYKIIAADVNNSASITVRDVLELRKLLLGIYAEFPENTSWKMIDAEYEFPNPADPFMEEYPLSSSVTLEEGVNSADFIGVKIGDVNDSNDSNGFNSTTPRNNGEELVFNIQLDQNNIEHWVDVRFSSTNFTAIDGFQFTFEFDANAWDFEGINASDIGLVNANLGLDKEHLGIITVSWNDVQPITLDELSDLFTFRFATTNAVVSESIDINSKYLISESYILGKRKGIDFNLLETGDITDFSLFQNAPNPWNEITSIKFELSEASPVSLKVLDMTGRLLWKYEGEFERGMNEVQLESSDISGTGVFYVEMTVNEMSKRNRMILLK